MGMFGHAFISSRHVNKGFDHESCDSSPADFNGSLFIGSSFTVK